jgi:isopentenyl-diphosphate delta-isomerase
MEVATRRRLLDELNLDTVLEYIYRFCYTAEYGEAGSENESCHVYLGLAPSELRPNENEIAGLRFITAADFDDELEHFPERFTPWCKQEWSELRGRYREQLSRYCALA